MIKKTSQALIFILCSFYSIVSLAGGPVTLTLTLDDVTDNPGSTFDVDVSWSATGQPNSCVWFLYKWTGSWTLIDSASVHWVGSESATLTDADYQLYMICEGNDDTFVDEKTIYFDETS